MTPEELLTLHASTPHKTSKHLSSLPPAVLSTLLSSLHTHPGLIQPLWSHPPLRTALLSQDPTPEALIQHLQTLSHVSAPLKDRLRTITISATTSLRLHKFALLIPLLQALSHLPGRTPSALREKLLLIFLAKAPLKPQFIQPLLELPFRPNEIRPVVTYITRCVTCTTAHHANLLTTLLTSPLPLAKPLIHILSAAENTALIAFEAALLHDITMAPYIANLITRTIFSSSAPVATPLVQCLFILLSHGDEGTHDQVSDTLSRMLHPGTVIRFTPPAEGSSGCDPRTGVFTNAVRKIPSGCEQDVTDFLESLFWKRCRNMAVKLLEEVFIWHPNSRTRILKAVITGLSTPASNVVHAGFMHLFKNLASQPTTSVAMRSCIDVLKEALDYVFIMPIGLDATFVEYLSRNMATIPGGRDRIMMFLRKVSGSRAIREQRVACRGLIAVLSVDAGDELHNDACDMLVMLSEADIGEYLIGLLVDFVERSSVHVERIGKVVKAITARVGIVADSGGMDICRYFELEPVGGLYVLCAPVSLMVRFCIAAERGALSPFSGKFLKYLCNERGALKDACAAERSQVPVVERLTLLCNLLETVIGLGVAESGEGVVRVYSVAIILRDLFAASNGGDDKCKQVGRRGKEEEEYLTMRQAAAARHVGGSLKDSKEGGLLNLLALRIQALSAVEKINADKIPVLMNVVRSEILAHVETEIRSVLALKEVTISSTYVDTLSFLIRKYFVISSPWTPLDKSSEESTTTEAHKTHDDPVTEPDKAFNDVSLAFVSALGIDKEYVNSFEETSLVKLQEETRIRMRQSSLSVLCTLLSRQLIPNDVVFLGSLTEVETAVEEDSNKTNEATNQRRLTREAPTSLPENREDERVLVVSRIAKLFHREFANSLSISLTLSYLAMLGHLMSKECKRSEDTKNVRKLVSNTLMSVLREYSIRHQSVMRSILKLLTNTFDVAAGIDFAKSVLVWLGNSPCLLDSRFVESDDGSSLKLGVDEFDRDILEEAIALDAVEESEEEEAFDCMNHDTPLGDPSRNIVDTSTFPGNGDENCLETTPRLMSDDADPVKSLCLDETPEVALLSVTAMLALCEFVLGKDIERYRQSLRSASRHTSAADEFVAEKVCHVLQEFCDTPFLHSFSSKSHAIPDLLLKRLSGIVHRLLETAQLVLQLLLKMFRNSAKVDVSKPHIRAASSILKILFDGEASEAILSVALQGGRRPSRSSLQEGVNVSATELFRYVSSKDCDLDEDTRRSVSELRKVLKSRKNRLPLVHSVRTPWTRSSDSAEPVSGDYFRVSRPQKKQRLRSRNPDVDEWLREEKDGDNYADLEDFVVAMDADEL